MTGMTRAEDIFGSPVGTLDSVGVDWARTVCVATDDGKKTEDIAGKKAGVVAKLKEKVHTAN